MNDRLEDRTPVLTMVKFKGVFFYWCTHFNLFYEMGQLILVGLISVQLDLQFLRNWTRFRSFLPEPDCKPEKVDRIDQILKDFSIFNNIITHNLQITSVNMAVLYYKAESRIFINFVNYQGFVILGVELFNINIDDVILVLLCMQFENNI